MPPLDVSPVQVLDLSTAQWWWKERASKPLHSTLVENDVLAELAVLDAPTSKDKKPDRASIQKQWYPARHFPSEIHVELLERNVIAHPYVAFNEHDVQCAFLFFLPFTAMQISSDAGCRDWRNRMAIQVYL